MLGAARLLKGFKATAEEEVLGIGFMDVVIRPTAESGIKEAYLLELQYLTQAAGTPAAVEAKLDDAFHAQFSVRPVSVTDAVKPT